MVYLDELTIQQLIKVINQRNFDPASKLFSEKVVLHCPGKSRISGDYIGKSGVVELWQNQIALTNETFRAEVVAASQGEGILVLIMDISAESNGQRYSWRRVNHYQLAGGRVVEGWIYESDQYTADAVFA